MNRSLSLLVHGHSKVGKSLLSVSGPTPRLYLDVESAARFLPIRPVTWDPRDPPPTPDDSWDTAVVSVRNWDSLRFALDWLRHGKHPFRSVGLDSISEAQNRYIESVAGRSTVKIDQWGSILREVGGMVRDLRDLTEHPVNPIDNLIITAMTREINGIYKPHVQGQLGVVLPYLLDVIGWLFISPGPDGIEHRMLQTRRTPTIEAGERVGGRIPPLIELPQVTGDTWDQVRERNVTMRLLTDAVFAMHSPAVVASATPATVPTANTADTDTDTDTAATDTTPTERTRTSHA